MADATALLKFQKKQLHGQVLLQKCLLLPFYFLIGSECALFSRSHFHRVESIVCDDDDDDDVSDQNLSLLLYIYVCVCVCVCHSHIYTDRSAAERSLGRGARTRAREEKVGAV